MSICKQSYFSEYRSPKLDRNILSVRSNFYLSQTVLSGLGVKVRHIIQVKALYKCMRYDGVLLFHSSQYLLMPHTLVRRDCYDLLNIHVKNIFVFWYVISPTLVARYLPMFSIGDSMLRIETVSPSETSATNYQATRFTLWFCTASMHQTRNVTFISRKST